MFEVIYYLLTVIVYIISLPLLLFALLKSKYRHSIPARFFLKDFYLYTSPAFWFHACSYGEIKSLEPIIKAMPLKPILITTITQTGFDLARHTYQDYAHIQVKFLPFEIFIPFWKKKLQFLQTLIITEAELWYLVLKTAKNVGAKTMLINSRISTHSFPRYKKIAWFYKRLFHQIDEVLAQGKDDILRLELLGAKNPKVFGNLKLLGTPHIRTHYPKSPKLTIIAASTHPGEEELILQAFLKLRDSLEKCWLIVVPRHPERFKEVERFIEKTLANTPYKYKVFSQEGFSQECDVLLADILGELFNLYAIGDVVILGGSFDKIGGHNPLEPAFFHTKLLSGPHIFNQSALFEAIEGYQIVEANQLAQTLCNYHFLPNTNILNQDNKLQSLLNSITNSHHHF
ncbi:lipid IV(A) 3-deoxy-D-manno-octulosonic acid transferase [Helicobacter sp. 11S03491-1]|uniref:lipid IV(A) 3-deoxy-D-manno-octulosonic acid transferase n=1 Tax=Helicobacter sp. 11S03491-1 TaxID=1476196 RepID=UPI000BA5196E|nr:lipid IV(A) 3-deoxy-D-manno-octulosonic acid transferase [Helicobacter sp. 11S03491-1]PAF41600.1 3-deoxy-D-manno-octulosonic acid transferase [Helicobacter sp. 11S03491-1]